MGRGEQRQEHLGRGWAWSRGQAAVLAVSRFSPVPFFMTPWTLAHQAPVSMGFSRQIHWSGEQPFPGDLPNPGTEPRPPALQADSLPSEPPGTRRRKK